MLRNFLEKISFRATVSKHKYDCLCLGCKFWMLIYRTTKKNNDPNDETLRAAKIPSIILCLFGFLSFIVLRFSLIAKLNPVYRAYSIFVFLYFGSRICASMFYKSFKKDSYEGPLPSVSFIIPVYNEEEAISKTISKCFEADYPPDKLEVVAINDGSTDQSLQNIRKLAEDHPNLVIIDLGVNKGKRIAMATGIKKASGEIFIQLDSDSYVESNSLVNLVAPFKDKKIGGVSAHTDPENKDENVLTKMQAAYYYLAFRVQKAAESSLGLVFCCSGCCSAYRREYLIDSLDDWIKERHLGILTTYGDDRALTNILIKKGFNTAYCSTAQAYTIVPNTLVKLIKQQKRWKKGWLIGTCRIASRIMSVDPFIGTTYIFPQLIIYLLSPAMIIYTFFQLLAVYRDIPYGYLLGFALVCTIYISYYSILRKDKYKSYFVLWAFLNLFISVIVFPYAILTLRDDKWGTR